MKTAEFGQPAAALPQPGVCRVCRCTEHRACLIETLGIDDPGKRPCGWADHTRTLCDNPECITEAKRELGFVTSSDGGPGRTSIKQSHRAEGRNFVD
jgi:hypothetical protein